MIRTLADQYLAQNAGRRYPFRDDTELPGWLSDAAVLDFRCTVRGVQAGTAPEARLTKAERGQDGSAQLTVALTAGGERLDTLQFPIPGDVAAEAPYTAYAAGEKAWAALTVTAAVLPPPGAVQLPYDAEVEFLKSTGTQWIDTGVAYDTSNSYLVKALCQFSEMPSGNFNYVAGWGAGGAFGGGPAGWTDGNTTGNGGGVVTSTTKVSITINAGKNGSTVTIFTPGNTVTRNPHSSLPNHTNGGFPLFGCYIPNLTKVANVRFYTVKVYVNGTLVRDFIPVRVGTTGAMYDRRGVGGMNGGGTARNDGMYFNRGSGNFGYGDDVSPSADGDTSYDVDIPFAATTVVCDSLKVNSIQSAQDPADALDKDDSAGLNATASVSGDVELAEGRNAEPYLDGNRLRIDIFKGGGLGERCQGVDEDAGQTCGTVLFTVNGERPGSDGELRIIGEDGITVTPYPEDHAVEIRMDDAAAAEMAAGCAPACQEG